MQAVLLVERPTTPLNPLRAVTIRVEEPVEFGLTVIESGVAVRVKSWTMYVNVAEWAREPLVPVIVRV